MTRRTGGRVLIGALVVGLGGLAFAGAHQGKDRDRDCDQDHDQDNNAASKLVGLYRLMGSTAACSDVAGNIPTTTDMVALHSGGTLSRLSSIQVVGPVSAPPISFVNGLGTWVMSGTNAVTLDSVQFVTGQQTQLVSGGYIVTHASGTVTSPGTITGTIEQRYVTSVSISCSAIGKPAPCQIGCGRGEFTMTSNDPFPVPAP